MAKLEFDQRPAFLLAITDSWVMIKRSSTHILRNRDQLLGTFMQPIMFLVLFSAVFGGAIGQTLPEGISYLNFLMAGIIVQTLAFGSTTTAFAVCNDMQKGIIDRFSSLPMSDLAVLNGHTVSDLFRNIISTVVMLGVGLLLGFRSNASVVDWLMIIGILLLFTFAFSWLSAIIGLYAGTIESVQWLTFLVIFPLTFASTAFVPGESMTPFLRSFAENQPITHVVEAIRSLMLGSPAGDHILLSIIWSLAILALSVPFATWLYRKKISS